MEPYSPPHEPERLIASARLALSAFWLVAIVIQPATLEKYRELAVTLLAGYVAYALLLVALTWRSQWPARYAVVIQIVDLLAAAALMVVTGGTSSPFFLLFFFFLLCASLRWFARGTAWTAGGTLVLFLGIELDDWIRGQAGSELTGFMMRCSYLAVAAILVGRLGAFQQRVRGALARLAACPKAPGDATDDVLARLLPWGAGVMGAPRALLLRDEPDEPWLYVGLWDGQFSSSVEAPDTFTPLIAPELADVDFLCHSVHDSRSVVTYVGPHGFRRWEGRALHPDFTARFRSRTVLSFNLHGETVRGRLFFLDKSATTLDDLMLGEVVSRHVATSLDHVSLVRELRDFAIAEERIRLARDLHDGALHSLAGVALQIDALLNIPDRPRDELREQLQEIRDGLIAEQRNLRLLIGQLRATPSAANGDIDLTGRVEQLAGRLGRIWGVRVDYALDSLQHLPSVMANEIYLVLHEALINVARHAKATSTRLQVRVREHDLEITVADDGHGFPFRGRRDHAALTKLGIGPVTLRERVSALGGTVAIASEDSGSVVEIAIPVRERRG